MESNFPRNNYSRSRSRSPDHEDGEFQSKSTHLFSNNIADDPSSYKYIYENDNGLFSEASLSTKSPAFIPHIPTTRCQFCHEQIPEDIINEHQNVCDNKNAFCQACGESVPLDLFDYHLESCQPMPNNFANLKVHDQESPYVPENHKNDESEEPENEWEDGEDEQNHYQAHQYTLPLIHHDHQHEAQDESDNEDSTNIQLGGFQIGGLPLGGLQLGGFGSQNQDQNQNPLNLLSQMSNLFMQLQANMQQHHQNNADEDDEDDWEDEMDEAEVQNYLSNHDPSTLTYEQLMVLDEGIVKKGLEESELEKFPLEMYLKDCDGEHSCSICLTEYESGEVMRKLTCSHRFHKDCVDTWLKSNITCPICKKYFR